MKKESRKLNLVRETLAPLQSDELEVVAGGSSPASAVSAAVSAFSARSSVACARAVSRSVEAASRHISNSSRWVASAISVKSVADNVSKSIVSDGRKGDE